jgi:hypothetical protein
MRLLSTEHTSRPWRIHELPFRTARSYLKARVVRTKLSFVTPPPDSMGP